MVKSIFSCNNFIAYMKPQMSLTSKIRDCDAKWPKISLSLMSGLQFNFHSNPKHSQHNHLTVHQTIPCFMIVKKSRSLTVSFSPSLRFEACWEVWRWDMNKTYFYVIFVFVSLFFHHVWSSHYWVWVAFCHDLVATLKTFTETIVL